MSYSFDTKFPSSEDQDLQTYLGLLKEKYCRMFPMIYYKSLLIPMEAASGQITTDPTKTVVDDLWGESVPQELHEGFVQPHIGAVISAEKQTVFAEPIEVNVNVVYSPKQKDQTTGKVIDEKHEQEYVFLNVQLEENNSRIKVGDSFIWKDHQYRVTNFNLEGRWFNTDYFLYTRVKADAYQQGS